jgi:hypothetical protein
LGKSKKTFSSGSKDFLKVQKNSIVQENEPKVTVGKFIVLSSLTIQEQLGNLLSLCREIAGARDILQKFENLKKQHE